MTYVPKTTQVLRGWEDPKGPKFSNLGFSWKKSPYMYLNRGVRGLWMKKKKKKEKHPEIRVKFQKYV